MAAATDITTVTNPSTGYYEANFTYSNPSNQAYLYLIYNYAGVVATSLKFGNTSLLACCLGSSASYFLNTSSFSTATSVYTDSDLTTLAPDGFYAEASGATPEVREQSAGLLISSSTCSTCNYIYISAVRSNKLDLCASSGTNYVMSVQAQTTTNDAFASVLPGDVLSVLPAGLPGFIAYSAVQFEDTATGTTYRIAEVNASGQIITLYFGGSGGTCGAPL